MATFRPFLSWSLVFAGAWLEFSALTQAADLGEGTVTALLPTVQKMNGGSSEIVSVGDKISAGGQIQTQAQAVAEITFPDGSKIRIGNNSTFSFDPNDRTVRLDRGSALVCTPPAAEGINIVSGGVSGTMAGDPAGKTFLVTAYPADGSGGKTAGATGGFGLVVLQGNAATTVAAPSGSVTIAPGQLAVIGASGGAPSLHTVDLAQVIRSTPLIGGFPTPLPTTGAILNTAIGQQTQISRGVLTPTGTSGVAITFGGQLLTAGSPPPNSAPPSFTMAVSTPGFNGNLTGTATVSQLANINTAGGGGGSGPFGGLTPSGVTGGGGGGPGGPSAPGSITTPNTSGQQGVTGNPTPISATATVTTKVYDGTTDADLTGASLTGSATSASLANDTTGTFASKNVGTGISVSTGMTLTGSGASLFRFTAPTLTGTITAKDLQVFNGAVTTKVYDGTDAAVVTGAVLVGNSTSDTDGKYIGNEVVTLGNNTAGTFASKNVGNRAVTTTMTLGGADSGNYTISQPTLTGTITAKDLNVFSAAVTTKVYDGTDAAVVTGAVLVGNSTSDTDGKYIGSETVTLSGGTSGTFADKNVGSGKSVSTTMTLGGVDAGNYTLSTQPTLTGTITAKDLQVFSAAVTTKVYDGTDSAVVTGAVLVGNSTSDTDGKFIGTEVVTLSGGSSGTFADKNVGTGKTVTTAMTLGGVGSGNYTLSTQPNLTGTITAKDLQVFNGAVTTKVYDGTDSAVVTGAVLVGNSTSDSDGKYIGNEVVTLGNNTAGTFASKNVGTGKSVSTTMTLGGAGSGNYTLSQPNLTGTITAKDITMSSSAVSKVYDGTTSATVTLGTLSGLVGSEQLQVSVAGGTGSGSFSSKDVGASSAVNVTYQLADDLATGGLVSNYNLTNPTENLTGTITAKALSVTAPTIADKVYDGQVTAGAVTVGTLSGFVGTETVTATGAAANYSSANVGTYNSVSVTYTLANGSNGGLAGNYSLAAGTATGVITAKALAVTAPTIASKVYDGQVTAGAVTVGTLSGFVGTETVTATGAAANYSSANVGTYNSVAVTYTLANGNNGGLAGNYSLAAGTATGVITAKPLSITAPTIADKVYDGQVTAGAVTVGTLSGFVGTETVTATGAAANYSSANVGTYNSVSVTYTLANGSNGGLAGNYSLAADTANGTITAKTLAVTAPTIADKVYDGQVTAGAVTVGTLSGFVGSETVTATGAAANYSSANVGSYSAAVTYTLADGSNGGLAGNYSLAAGTATGVITAKALSVTAPTIASKVYDGQVTAGAVTVGTLSGFAGTETVTASGVAANYSSANVGTYNSVAVSYTLANGSNGGLAGNYSLAAGTANGTITAKPLSITAPTIASKVYDGQVTAGAVTVGTLSGFVGTETVTATGAAANYSSANVGTYNSVAVTYTLANGNNGGLAGNYSLAAGTATGVITAKPLSITAPTIADKVYDGQVTAGAVTVGTLSGFVGTETVTATGAAANYSSANVGTYNSVAVTYTLANGNNGGLAGNYSLAAGTATGVITAKDLVVNGGGITVSKAYDGGTAINGGTDVSFGISALTGGSTGPNDGKYVGTENVTLAVDAAGTFERRLPGTEIPISTTVKLASGNAVNDNYTLRGQPTGLKGEITGSATLDQNGAALNVSTGSRLHVRNTTATRMQNGMTFQTSAGEVLIENSSFDGWMQRSSTATKVDDGGAVTFQFTESAAVAVNSPVLRIKMEANDPNAAPGAGGANLDYMLLGDYQMQLRHDPDGTPANGDELTKTIFSLPGSADDPSGIGSIAPAADLVVRDTASTEFKDLDWNTAEYTSLDGSGNAVASGKYATASGEYKPDSPAAMSDFNTLTAAGDWEVDVADPALGGEGKVTDLRLKYNNNTKVLIEGPDGVRLLNVKFEGMDEVDVRTTDLNNRVLMSATLLTDPDITKMVVKASQTLEAVINSDATFKEVKSLSNADLLAGVVRDNSSPTGFSFVSGAERTLTIDGPGAAAATPNINIAGQLAIAAHTVVFNNANIASDGVIGVRTRDGMVNRTYGTVVPGTTSFTGNLGNYFLNRNNGNPISMTIGSSADISANLGTKLTDVNNNPGAGTVMSVGRVQ